MQDRVVTYQEACCHGMLLSSPPWAEGALPLYSGIEAENLVFVHSRRAEGALPPCAGVEAENFQRVDLL